MDPETRLESADLLGQCRFHDSVWRPSAQIGVLVRNDARIYQLL